MMDDDKEESLQWNTIFEASFCSASSLSSLVNPLNNIWTLEGVTSNFMFCVGLLILQVCEADAACSQVSHECFCHLVSLSRTTLCVNRWCSLFRQFGISCKPFAQILGALGSFGATFQKEYEYVHSSPEGGELRIVCRSVSIVNEC